MCQFFIFLLILTLLVTGVAADGQIGSTLTVEYEYFSFQPPILTEQGKIERKIFYDFKVILWIETEKDGTWKKGSIYHIKPYLQVNYIDFNYNYNEYLKSYSSFNFTNLRIFSENPNLVEITPVSVVNVSLTIDSPWYSPIGLGLFIAKTKVAGKVKLFMDMDVEHRWGRPSFNNYGREVIITIVEEAFVQTPIVYTSIGTIIGAIAGVISTATYFKFKTRKSSQEHLKTLCE